MAWNGMERNATICNAMRCNAMEGNEIEWIRREWNGNQCNAMELNNCMEWTGMNETSWNEMTWPDVQSKDNMKWHENAEMTEWIHEVLLQAIHIDSTSSLFPELPVSWPASSLDTSSLSSFFCSSIFLLSQLQRTWDRSQPLLSANCPIAGRSHHHQITLPRVVTMVFCHLQSGQVSSTSCCCHQAKPPHGHLSVTWKSAD